MDRVALLIGQFRSMPFDNDDDGSRRVEVILELADDRGDSRVLDLFLAVVADPAEYDLARIECLKILDLWPPAAPDDRQRAGRTIATLLWPDEDYLVRQYAAMSLGPYARDDVVFDALAEVLLHDDDIDVRHNALSSVTAAGADDRRTALLRQLSTDPEMGRFAVAKLRDWGEDGRGY
jgi:hypothetical protein